jgi:hypothetical protein
MKVHACIVAMLLGGCASTPSQYLSVEEVLGEPARFDGREISVCGWFESGMETCTLNSGDGREGMWVAPRSDVCAPENWRGELRGQWAVVNGTFHTGQRYGHLGLYSHALAGGVPKSRPGKCPGLGGAPNESFKPTPLRGAA